MPLPCRFTSWKQNSYTSYRRVGWPQGRYGRLRNTSPKPGFNSRTLQYTKQLTVQLKVLNLMTHQLFYLSLIKHLFLSSFVSHNPLSTSVTNLFYLCPVHAFSSSNMKG
jgi:hypothetical protein